MKNICNYLAHVREESSEWKEHDLFEHLCQVALKAKQFADEFGSGDWAYIAGLWHDLGKFSSEFQSYIRSKSGYDMEASSEDVGRVNHSSAGALLSIEKFGKIGRILAYLIAGHHAGLPDWHQEAEGGSLSLRLKDQELLTKARRDDIPSDFFNLARPEMKFKCTLVSLWIRMLFSCLVDADFLDTEQFMDLDKHALRSSYPSIPKLKTHFDAFMATKENSVPDSEVNQRRREILRQCRERAFLPSGLFSLTVPTGGGKTLSSMAFALDHALCHGKKRIIYVIPFTSIIEQTADVYRTIFGDAVIEHHSNIDPEKQTTQNRLATENWDAPIVVTTNVQFFESLFSSKTSRTRKLHNLVNSVIIFDEAQQLPLDFLEPILTVLQELSDKYKITCVFATATQPALNEKKWADKKFPGLKNVTEIIQNVKDLHSSLKRVEISLPTDFNLRRSWEDIAKELKAHRQILCIVNSRKDCRDLFSIMPSGTIHLSGLMCGAHRSEVIREIKERLAKGKEIRVISTQLVEAGVDIDFPVVYRAVAGLDSIAQAAGRCNREGRLSEMGQVVVFVPPRSAPPGHLRKGEEASRNILKLKPVDPLAPEIFIRYFEHVFWMAPNLDKYEIKKLLFSQEARYDAQIQFRTASSLFNIIDDSKYAPVFVRYGEGEAILDQINSNNLDRFLLRKLQRYTVSIPKSLHRKLLVCGRIQEIPDTGIFKQTMKSLYHTVLGFLADPEDSLDPEDFFI